LKGFTNEPEIKCYILRIIFDFVKVDVGEDNILLIEIGTHEEVY